MGIYCDVCGKEMNDQWKIEGMPGVGGNCPECGDNLCAECARPWSEDGWCGYCAMTLEELEFSLPLAVQRQEKMKMPCPDCKKARYETAAYEQRVWRSDDHFAGEKKRFYEISFADGRGKVLLRTKRCRSFREALIEAHKSLDRKGVKK